MASDMAEKKLSSTINMCEGPLFKKILSFTVPIVFTELLQLLFNAADLVVVGRFCGSNSVAAVGATTSLIHLIVNLFIGISSGAGVAVATAIGAGNNDTVSKTVHTALPLSAVCGALLTVIGIFCAKPMLELMGTPDDVVGLAALYVRIYSCGMIPSMVYNFGAAILRADGNTKRPLFFLTVSGIINIFLNLGFVIFLHMDVAGVALATSISQLVSAVLVVTELMRQNDACKFSFKKAAFNKIQLKTILKIGVPAGLQSCTFSLSNVIIQSSINTFGSLAVAGGSAASSIEAFVLTPSNAFQQAALNFAGQNYGAGKIDRVRKTLRICLISAFVSELVFGTLSNIFSEPLLSLYITDSAEAIAFGARRMMIVAQFYFIIGPMNAFSGILRGMGHSTSPMIISFFSNCIFRVLWLATAFKHIGTWETVYLSYPLSWTIALCALAIIYTAVMKKYRRAKSLALHHK